MKLNLSLNDPNPRAGYVNIDPFTPLPGDRGSLTDLNERVDDAECDEVIATDVLDYFQASDSDKVFMHWLSKLRHGGTIIIGGLDLPSVCRAVAEKQLSLTDANLLIYGKQAVPAEYRKSATSLATMTAVLEGRGLKILHARLENYFYNIKAERP